MHQSELEDDFLLNNEYKSDKYEISLNHLFFNGRYSLSAKSIKAMLDDNGYYGRHDIEIFKDRKHELKDLLKVHVYLCDSCYTYTWPHQTYFILSDKAFGHNRKAPRGVLNDKSMFKRCFSVMATMFTPINKIKVPYSWFDAKCLLAAVNIEGHPISNWPLIICKSTGTFEHKQYYERIIPFLFRNGLIVNNKFLIRSAEDATEITSNLFDIDFWHNI